MFLKNSRYSNAKSFDNDSDGNTVFSGVRPREIGEATGVVEHIVTEDDRLDLLARHYYNNDRMWWRIADANPEIIFAGNMLSEDMVGKAILIPKMKE